MTLPASSQAILWLLRITMNEYYKGECKKSIEQMYEYY